MSQREREREREREGKFYSALSHFLFVGLWLETRKERSTWIEPNPKTSHLVKKTRKRLKGFASELRTLKTLWGTFYVAYLTYRTKKHHLLPLSNYLLFFFFFLLIMFLQGTLVQKVCKWCDTLVKGSWRVIDKFGRVWLAIPSNLWKH